MDFKMEEILHVGEHASLHHCVLHDVGSSQCWLDRKGHEDWGHPYDTNTYTYAGASTLCAMAMQSDSESSLVLRDGIGMAWSRGYSQHGLQHSVGQLQLDCYGLLDHLVPAWLKYWPMLYASSWRLHPELSHSYCSAPRYWWHPPALQLVPIRGLMRGLHQWVGW